MSCSEKEKLLNEVLRDANYQEFRADLFALSREEFRKHRRSAVRSWWGIAASILIGVGLAGSFGLRRPEGRKTEPIKHIPLLEYVPTVRLEPAEILRSVLDQSILIETGSQNLTGVEVVSTGPAPISQISDAQLLALFPNTPVGFLQKEGGRQLVIFQKPSYQ